MVLRTCQQVEGGLPKDVQAKMMFNIIVDFGIGLVPFLGDIADALFRANTKNAVVLEKYLRQKGAKTLKQQGQVQNLSDPTDPDEFDRHLREEVGPPPQYTTGPPSRHDNGSARPAQTQEATVPAESRGGWFSGFGSKKKQPDVERAELRRREDDPLPSIPNDGSRQERNTVQKSRR
ncbi:hypothetical protein LARI1_G008351 [Lachnellula arida]|uniref:PH domain-containing protein n=1 Tax=Lachnellula arida TaxID=1316785 RepID=A0A8T9B073_9HELO|nr:hypothetical protein LARI1_G008351 [Lachnellula arida]